MAASPSLRWFASVLVALAAGAGVAWWAGRKPPPPPDAASAPVLSLEKLGHLVSLRVNYTDVIEFDAKRTQDIPFTQFELRFGGTKVLLVARGDCTVGTDLSKAKFENVSAPARTLKLVLPAQLVLNARINHEPRDKGGSYFYAISTHGLEPIIPDSSNREQATNSALAKAQTTLQSVCASPSFIGEARKNAEQVLTAALAATGWTPTFEWR
jgi:hypothetical protein